jgi:hypothetical protein
MRVQKLKWNIKHPYYFAAYNKKWDSRDITVDVEGETLHGVPHGQCFVNFIYNGEFENDLDDYEKPEVIFDESSPYLDS